MIKCYSKAKYRSSIMVIEKKKSVAENLALITARIKDHPKFVEELEVYTRTLDVEKLESHNINDVDELIAERSQGLNTRCVETWLDAESQIANDSAPVDARIHRKKK